MEIVIFVVCKCQTLVSVQRWESLSMFHFKSLCEVKAVNVPDLQKVINNYRQLNIISASKKHKFIKNEIKPLHTSRFDLPIVRKIVTAFVLFLTYLCLFTDLLV